MKIVYDEVSPGLMDGARRADLASVTHARVRRGPVRLAGLLAIAVVALPCVWADEVFDEKGFNQARVTFSELPYEHIDPLTGNLLLTFTDLSLPGNAGFDLRIQRTYNSKIHADYQRNGVRLGEDSWAGVGWRIHFGRLLNSTAAVPGPIEMPDGSQHKLFNHISSPGLLITREYWVYDPIQRQLRFPNGMTYTLNRPATIYDGLKNVSVLYVTQMRDPFGNTVALEYQQGGPPDALSRIVQDLGDGQQRTVTFQTDATARRALSTMTYNSGSKTYVWTYSHDPSEAAYSLLASVVGPEGLKWQYTYDKSGTSTSRPYELKSLTAPYGGRIDYVYSTEQAEMGSRNYVTFRAVKKRTVSGPELTNGTWTYEWQRLTPVLGGYSVAVSPCGWRTEYKFDLNGGSGFAWRVGSLIRKTVTLPSGSGELESETFEWQASAPISLDSDTRQVGMLSWGDPDVFVPLLKERTLRRDQGATYATRHEYRNTNFNDYGRAWRTTETGDAGTRTTERAFPYAFTPYIRDKVSSEKVTVRRKNSAVGETFSRSWAYNLANGFLIDRYDWGETTTSGIRMRYGPTTDGRGNVGTATDGNGHSSTYSYSWGALSRVVKPAHPTIDTLKRTINPEGTVAQETRRVATSTGPVSPATTSFEYDLSLRPTKRTPPAGLPITTSYHGYDLSGGATITVTRGAGSLQSRIVTKLDGFGRPIETENSVDAKTSTSYDACGRRSYESYPYSGTTHEGTSYDYDGLGRLRRKTNTVDDTSSTIAYDGLDVTITDENGHVTSQHWAAFGGPEDKLLVSVTAGVGSAEANTTAYTYNALGRLESVTHPGELKRRWEYFADNALLEKETHPESGTVSFTYDDAGNRITRSNTPYAWTSFTYDENNRLTAVNRHGSDLEWRHYSTTYGYDPSNNQTFAANAYVTSEFTYDLGGRLESRTDEVRPTGEGHAATTFLTNWGYDDYENLEYVHYPRSIYDRAIDSMWVWYRHDTQGRVTSVGTLADRGSFANSFTYHPSGAVKSFTAGNGLRHEATYDERQRIETIDSGWVLSLTYGYANDNVGNPTSITETSRPDMSQSLAYDALDRLQTATGVWGEASFSYDALGNQLSKTIGTSATTYAIDTATNRLSSASGSEVRNFSYDSNGNTIADEVNTYTYTPDNLISAATTANGTSTYRYDADMQRKMTLSGGPNRYFIHGAGQILSEFEEPSPGEFRTVRSHVYAGGRLLAFVRPANAVSLNFPAASAVAEEAGSHPVGVTLVTTDGQPTQWEVRVAFSTSDRTAVAGRDYEASSGSLVFPRGSASGTTMFVPLALLDDALDEDDETLDIQLSGPVGADLANTIHTVTVSDSEDPAPSALVSPATVMTNEGNVGLSEVSFEIGLSAPAGRTVTVSYVAEGGTAAAGTDFIAQSGSVDFAPGTTTPQTAKVRIIGDTLVEPEEDFTLRITDASNASVGASGRVVIANDDSPASLHAAPSDFDADGQSDILWHNQQDGDLDVWLMSGSVRNSTSDLAPSPVEPGVWQIRGVADLNRDGLSDILWQHQTGDLSAWFMNGRTQAGAGDLIPAAATDPDWQVSGLADFDHDGSQDLLWRHQTSGELQVWLMNGVVRARSLYLEPRVAPSPTWQIRGLADFDGDGQTDVLWHDQASGGLQIWFLAGTTATRVSSLDPPSVPDTNWQVRMVADFNADQKPDLLWYQNLTGDLHVWFMDGTSMIGVSDLSPSRVDPPNWQIAPR